MILLLVVAVGVLLYALAHLVVGWFIASGIDRDVLAVGPRPKVLNIRVRAISRDRIVLEAPEPRQDIGHPGTLGLVWEEGYGRLGEVVDVEGFRVTREYMPMNGTPPVCTGQLDECPPVDIDPFVFPRNPADVGLEFVSTTYDSPLGEMGAWLIPARDTTSWAVLCHGWTAERRELVRMLPAFHRAGFNSLVIDYRNDPDGPEDPSRRYRFGLTEWEDVESAVGHAIDRGGADIVVGGCSTGGALVMAFLERSPVAKTVSGVFLDSPNLVLAEAIRNGTRQLRATPLMIEFGMWIADLRWKVDWEATNYVSRAERILTVPTLVFHGTSDQTIPISVSRQLEAKVPGLVELVETAAAGHVMSWNADPDRYERYLVNFLARI